MKLKLCNNGLSVFGQREDGVIVSYSIEADEYKQWLSEGNTPEPEFTEEELAKQELDKTNSIARAELQQGDWKVLRELERLFLKDTELNSIREALRAEVQ